MTLDEYLRRLRLRHLVLQCPWWDIRVCCSRDLHRKYWTYRNGQWACMACAKLAEWIA